MAADALAALCNELPSREDYSVVSLLTDQNLAESEVDEMFQRLGGSLGVIGEPLDCDVVKGFWIFRFGFTYVLLRRCAGTRHAEANFFAADTLADAWEGTAPDLGHNAPLRYLQWVKAVRGPDGEQGWQTYSFQAEPSTNLHVALLIAGLVMDSNLVIGF